jgi:hypothetical protein
MADPLRRHRSIERVFGDLFQKMRPCDVYIFYAAGQGVTHQAGYDFIPQDFDQTDESFAKAAIGLDGLQAWLAKIPAKKSMLIFDTCESGSLPRASKARRSSPFGKAVDYVADGSLRRSSNSVICMTH